MRAPARVSCYSGYRADERPLSFQIGEHEYLVVDILERWYAPDEAGYRVLTAGDGKWILRHTPVLDQWTAEPG